ncbi:MAG: M56 family metallopeptidase [Acidobacteriota bacterium]
MEMASMAEAVRWMVASFQGFAQVAGPVAVAALWQGAMVAAVLALCLRLAPRVAAADRFRAWSAGFAALVALPFFPYWMAAVRGSSASTAWAGADEPMRRAWLDLDPRWTLAIAALWILVALVRVADLALHTIRLRSLWKRATPIEISEAGPDPLTMALLARLKSCPGTQRIEVCTTLDLDRPSVIGFLRPRILIPEWLLEKLSPAELEQVVLHEAEHLHRGDDWTNLLQKLALIAFPLHPALAWMERQLCREREMACDEAVVRATEKPRSYASCLASLAERGMERELARRTGRRAEALSLGAWRGRPELAERVHRILRRGPGLHPAAARALLGMVACGLLLGSLELARLPQVVAFVAPAQPATAAMEATPAQAAPTAYFADGMSGFHAMNATIRIPETVEGRPNRTGRSPLRAADRHRGRAMQESVARTAEPGAATADRLEPAAARATGAQQWVVFAAWEQVETASTAAGSPANQAGKVMPAGNAAAAGDGMAAAVGRSAPGPQQITVTRLVVIYPAEAARAGAGAAGSKSGLSTPFVAGWPARIPLRDGWLVFQL